VAGFRDMLRAVPMGTSASQRYRNKCIAALPEAVLVGLIDMGGRVYDPLAGRFMTADRVTQAPFGHKV